MSVKTSVSSTAQSLSTRPGMLSGPGALRALILLQGSSHAVRGQRHHLVAGRRVESSVQWCCFVPQKRAKKHSARSAGGWCCHRSVVGGLFFVVRNGLYSLPQAPSVSLSLKRWAILWSTVSWPL